MQSTFKTRKTNLFKSQSSSSESGDSVKLVLPDETKSGTGIKNKCRDFAVNKHESFKTVQELSPVFRADFDNQETKKLPFSPPQALIRDDSYLDKVTKLNLPTVVKKTPLQEIQTAAEKRRTSTLKPAAPNNLFAPASTHFSAMLKQVRMRQPDVSQLSPVLRNQVADAKNRTTIQINISPSPQLIPQQIVVHSQPRSEPAAVPQMPLRERFRLFSANLESSALGIESSTKASEDVTISHKPRPKTVHYSAPRPRASSKADFPAYRVKLVE